MSSKQIRKMHFNDAITQTLLLSITGHDIIHDYGCYSDISRWANNYVTMEKFAKENGIVIPDYTYFYEDTSVISYGGTKQSDQLTSPIPKRRRYSSSDSNSESDAELDLHEEPDSESESVKSKLSQFSDKRAMNLFEEQILSQEKSPEPNKVALSNVFVAEGDAYPPEYLEAISGLKDFISTNVLLSYFYKYLYHFQQNNRTVIDKSVLPTLLMPDYDTIISSSDSTTSENEIKKLILKETGTSSRTRSTKKNKSAKKKGHEKGHEKGDTKKEDKKEDKKKISRSILIFLKVVTNQLILGFTISYTSTNYKNVMDELTNYIHINLHVLIENYFLPQKSKSESGIKKQKGGSYPPDLININQPIKILTTSKDYELFYKQTERLIKSYHENTDKKVKLLENLRTHYHIHSQGSIYEGLDLTAYNVTKDKLTKLLVDPMKEKKKNLEDQEKAIIRDFQKDFMQFVARSSLFLNNICNKDGTLTSNARQDMKRDVYMNLQASILIKQANWDKINKGSIIPVSKNLDDELLNFMIQITNTNIPSIVTPNGLIVTNSTTKTPSQIKAQIESNGMCNDMRNHVSNNAATALPNKGKERTVCSTSALLDGMSMCSYDADKSHSTQKSWERGNMNFMITNKRENIYYHGMLMLDSSDEKKVTLNLDVKTKSGFILGQEKQTSVVDESLKAYIALGNALKNIMIYIIVSDHGILDNGNIMDNLFTEACKQKEEKATKATKNTYTIFNEFYSEILFKGVGDLFQEINSACKFGGYVEPLPNNKNNIDFDVHGNAIRYFVANDRPSGFRFVLFVTFGKGKENTVRSEINSGAFGGYLGDMKQLIVEREGKPPCNENEYTRANDLRSRNINDASRSISLTTKTEDIGMNLVQMKSRTKTRTRKSPQNKGTKRKIDRKNTKDEKRSVSRKRTKMN